jgi:hypothetical protein
MSAIVILIDLHSLHGQPLAAGTGAFVFEVVLPAMKAQFVRAVLQILANLPQRFIHVYSLLIS